jgi:hypothetical protein
MKNHVFASVLIIVACKANRPASDFDSGSLSPATAERVSALVEFDFVGTERIARQDETSVAFTNRQALMDTATDEELLNLMGHPEGEVVATAFEALAKRRHVDLKRILLDLSEGEKRVNYLQGDVFLEMSVIEYAYVYVLNNQFEQKLNAGEPVPIGLKPEEKAFIENRIKALRQRG